MIDSSDGEFRPNKGRIGGEEEMSNIKRRTTKAVMMMSLRLLTISGIDPCLRPYMFRKPTVLLGSEEHSPNRKVVILFSERISSTAHQQWAQPLQCSN